jgi:hypothetical protein
MIKSFFKLSFILLLLSFTTACLEEGTSTSYVDGGGSVTNVGTIVAPSTKPQSLEIGFTAVEDVEDEEEGDSEMNVPFDTDKLGIPPYCKITSNAGNAKLNCAATPSEFSMSVHAIWAKSCSTPEGEDELCYTADQETTTVEFKQIYAAASTPVKVEANATESPFDAKLDISNLSFSALRFAVSSVGETIPYSNEVEAGKFPEYVQGMPFKVCTAPTDITATICGDQSQTGDWMIDTNDDGTFGFMSPKFGVVSEIENRPDSYRYNQNIELIANLDILPDELSDYEGYLTPGFHMKDIITIEEGVDSKLSITLILKDTFRYWRPLDSIKACIDLTEEECIDALAEERNVGTYNPTTDYLMFSFPAVQIQEE